MIQRQQTLWLILVVTASILSFLFPFYSGNKIGDSNISTFDELTAGSSFFLLVLTGASVLISGISIFLYSDRKAQLKLMAGGILISIILIILYFVGIKKFQTGNFALTSVFVFFILIGYVMAARGIWKDEKLVKSLDKLR
jgi:ABC-type Na+ efflux pump permease subunit